MGSEMCIRDRLCTGLAVLGGRFIAQKISVRIVTLCGAVVFLFFGFAAFYMGPEDDTSASLANA